MGPGELKSEDKKTYIEGFTTSADLQKHINEKDLQDEELLRHSKILEYIGKLYEKKNNDYGNSFSKLFQEYGPLSLIIRLEDKLTRFKTLVRNNKAMVEDESMRDTLIDIANYAVLGVMEMDKEEDRVNDEVAK